MEKQKWRCTVCGYIHEGDKPPDECPVCGVGPEKFELITGGEKDIKSSLYKISYGLFVVSSFKEEKMNGQACNTLFQISSKPYTIAISINKDNLTNDYIKASGVFTASILRQNAHNIVRRFGYRSGREMNKFEGVDYFRGLTGAPILTECLAYMECKVIPEKTLEVFTHNIFVGEVVAGKVLMEEDPMTYEYYRRTK